MLRKSKESFRSLQGIDKMYSLKATIQFKYLVEKTRFISAVETILNRDYDIGGIVKSVNRTADNHIMYRLDITNSEEPDNRQLIGTICIKPLLSYTEANRIKIILGRHKNPDYDLSQDYDYKSKDFRRDHRRYEFRLESAPSINLSVLIESIKSELQGIDKKPKK